MTCAMPRAAPAPTNRIVKMMRAIVHRRRRDGSLREARNRPTPDVTKPTSIAVVAAKSPTDTRKDVSWTCWR